MAKKGRQSTKILHRYHFSSALKRMSVIASVHSASDSVGANNHIVATKGAPETLRKMVSFFIHQILFYFLSYCFQIVLFVEVNPRFMICIICFMLISYIALF